MFEITEYIGIIAFAMSGFFVAVRSRLDSLGVLISVFLTAFGGGIIRDVLVDRTPYTFTHDMPAVITIGVLIVLILFRFNKRATIENRFYFILSDSIGLISFSITGTMIAIESALNLTGVLALAFVTAVGGGITRDVIINEVPFVFKTGFYGTVSLLIGLVIYLLEKYDLLSVTALITVFIGGVVLRMVAYYKKWAVPMI